MKTLTKTLKQESLIGVAGNRSTGKTHTVLSLLLEVKQDHPNVPIYVFGINESLHPTLESKGILILRNKTDILDLRLNNCIIFVDEMAMFFDSQTRSKQLTKLSRFFDRIEHNNCKFILGTAREGYFNKFMCSRIQCFIVKETEYDALVNGTWLKEKVLGIESLSDYRLEAPKNTYYIVSNRNGLTSKHTSEYNPKLDSKKDNLDLFQVHKDDDKPKPKVHIKPKYQKKTLEEKGFITVVKNGKD